jgi:hypothetical protein
MWWSLETKTRCGVIEDYLACIKSSALDEPRRCPRISTTRSLFGFGSLLGSGAQQPRHTGMGGAQHRSCEGLSLTQFDAGKAVKHSPFFESDNLISHAMPPAVTCISSDSTTYLTDIA